MPLDVSIAPLVVVIEFHAGIQRGYKEKTDGQICFPGPGGIETIAKAEGLECHSHVTGAINATERALPG